MNKIKNIKTNVRYTLNHKKAFLMVEKSVLGKNTIAAYLHDADKIFLYFLFSKKTVSKIHRKYSRHHMPNALKKEKYILHAIIDWECARYTKADKPLDAYETMKLYYPETEKSVVPVLKKYNLMK